MSAPATSYRIGAFILDSAAYRLLKGTTPIDLSPKALDLLLLLARQPGALVTKDDILAAVWPDVAVTDNALTQVISDLRLALGDQAADPTYIETVPRRGYRFIAAVEPVSLASPPGPGGKEGAAPRVRPRGIAVADFANVSNEAEVAWLAAGIAETVTNDLRAIHDLRVMDRGLVGPGPPGDVVDAARAAGLDLVVTGSFQRAGTEVRITARALDVRTREAVAHAKADGPLADVFRVQDAIVTQLSVGLQLTVTPAAAARIRTRETSSLDAYRALTEGRLRLEALDPAEIPAAVAAFERALSLDPQYGLAHVGLAHARFWQFQATRAQRRPDAVALAAAIAHAEQAIALDPGSAEAHSALGFFLASADRREAALAAGRHALALEPGNWRHQFRLGMAAWGDERLACLEAVIAQYPALAYAYVGLAMVRVARGELDRAEQVLRAGVASDRLPAAGAARFPSSGLHGLLGLLRLAAGDVAEAHAEFDQELQRGGSPLFAAEYAMDAADGHGWARLASHDAAGAAAMFTATLAHASDRARSLVGLTVACQALGARDQAEAAAGRAAGAIEDMRSAGRPADAALVTALWRAASGQPAEAVAILRELVESAAPGSTGWTIPIEALLAPLRNDPAFREVLTRLAERAR
jgi:DNA-binding winged helix-turn-helix (wHTH) protein/tetratricopeptide (TPR) repeat protein